MRPLVAIGVIWTCLAAGAQVDSTAVAADSTLATAAPDTSDVSADPVWAWKGWPPIAVAITLAPLDGA
jgi:hypothetical protein